MRKRINAAVPPLPPICDSAAHRKNLTFRTFRVKWRRKNELEGVCMGAVVGEMRAIHRCMGGMTGTRHTAVCSSVSGTVPVKVQTVTAGRSVYGSGSGGNDGHTSVHGRDDRDQAHCSLLISQWNCPS